MLIRALRHVHRNAGWAEDMTCGGESKDYYYANRRPALAWYHDHALEITSGALNPGTCVLMGVYTCVWRCFVPQCLVPRPPCHL